MLHNQRAKYTHKTKSITRGLRFLLGLFCAYAFFYSSFAYSLAALSPVFKAGDLAPRGAPDGQLNAGDLVVLQRIILGEIVPTTHEILVGDVAPYGQPDGVLNAADLSLLQRAVLGEITLTDVTDTQPPQITIISPTNNGYTNSSTATISGKLDEPGTLTINSTLVTIDSSLAFSQSVNLQEGPNTFTLVATDIYGNTGSQTFTINKDTQAPAPINPSLLTISTTGPLTTITGAAGSVEAGATVSVTANGVTKSVTANADGSFSISITASTGTQLQITVLDSANNSSTPYLYTIGGIQILSPQDGDTINTTTANVVGTYTASDINSGVNVNGSVACVYGNNFYVNNLPLMAGANTLTASGSSFGGAAETASVNVTQNGVSAFNISVSTDCGIAPMATTFKLNTNENTAQQLDIDYNGDGNVDITTSTPSSTTLQYTYTQPGVYPVTAWVTSNGTTQQLSLNIVVHDPQSVDDIYQAVWKGMWTALKAGDKATALQYLTPGAVREYGGIFDSLMSHMTNIYNEFSSIQPVETQADSASYAVLRLDNGVVKTYFINFTSGSDGVRRIDSM